MRILPGVLPCLALVGLTALSHAGDDFKLEPGFTLLLNGKDLSGWKTKTGNEDLQGKTEAYKGRFTVKEGVLRIDPAVKGDVRIATAKELAKDFHLKFDFKPDAKCNNDLFIRGQKFDLTKSNVKNLKEDEWNPFEIIVKGDKIEFKNNGETQRTATTKGDSSVLEVRAEFGSMQIRRMRIMGGLK